MILSHGHLLAGRLRYAQPSAGFRSGIEPVLLAAAVPAAPGARVLEAGCGAGAATLCLRARIPGLAALAVERDPAMAAVARGNLAANPDGGPALVVVGDAAAPPAAGVDHAFANPPWHPAAGTRSPSAGRDAAKRAAPGIAAAWVSGLAGALRPGGSLTLIVPAARLPAWLAALTEGGCGGARLLPLWPRAGRAAKLVLIQGRRGGRGDCAVLPGLVLHGEAGFTPAADAILRGGDGLPMEPGP